MKKSIGVLIFICFCSYWLVANTSDSSQLKINKIIEFEHHKYVYNSPADVDYYFEIRMSILNKDADIDNYLVREYDDFHKIEDIEGEVFDQNGKRIKVFRNKDIQDVMAYDGFSIANDARKKVIQFENNNYPYTLHLKVKNKIKSLFYPLTDSYYNGKNSFTSLYTITYDLPDGTEHNIIIKNTDDKFSEKKVANRILKEFKKENVGPFKHVVLEQHFNEIFPFIYVKFPKVDYSKYKAEIRNWKDHGDFIYMLNKDRDVLPPTEISKVEELTADLINPKDKVKKLFEYMQGKTRYISIQLGIGGHQPTPAQEVCNLGYGDCKGLSNYMYSLLKAAGIKSNYVVILAGPEYQGKTYDDDVIPSFNHAILAVPIEGDTIWLECTSQSNPMNYMGSFTGNRQALWVEEGASKIVNTHRYTAKDNLVTYHATVDIDEKGSCKIVCNNTYYNVSGENLFSAYTSLNNEKLDDYFNRKFDIPSYTIQQKSVDLIKAENPISTENLTIDAPYYASIQGKRLFIVPNILSKTSYKLDIDSSRIADFNLSTDMEEVDTIVINIPAGYKLENMPKNINISKPYGSYKTEYKVEENKIYYLRSRTRLRNIYSGKMFNEYVKDINAIYNSDRSKIVLVKI
jgi:hypothetical protein